MARELDLLQHRATYFDFLYSGLSIRDDVWPGEDAFEEEKQLLTAQLLPLFEAQAQVQFKLLNSSNRQAIFG